MRGLLYISAALLAAMVEPAAGLRVAERAHDLHAKVAKASGLKRRTRDIPHDIVPAEVRVKEYEQLKGKIERHTASTGGAWAGYIPEHLVHHFAGLADKGVKEL